MDKALEGRGRSWARLENSMHFKRTTRLLANASGGYKCLVGGAGFDGGKAVRFELFVQSVKG